MQPRRLQRIAKVVRSVVSNVIQNELSDPRIQGLVSVTRVEVSADLRQAKVYLSILGQEEPKQQLTLRAIQHAAGHVQSRVAESLATKVTPVLKFFLDDSLKEGYKIVKLLDQVAQEELRRDHPDTDDALSSHTSPCLETDDEE